MLASKIPLTLNVVTVRCLKEFVFWPSLILSVVMRYDMMVVSLAGMVNFIIIFIFIRVMWSFYYVIYIMHIAVYFI